MGEAKPTCKTTGMPCCRCQPVCEHRGDGFGKGFKMMILCPKCNNIADYNSYFNAFICKYCNWIELEEG